MSDRMTAEQEEQMRAEFEAAMREKHPEWSFTPDPVFDYHNERTRCSWEGYQAATLAAQARTAEVVERAVEALERAHKWHLGDKWRDSKDGNHRQAWRQQEEMYRASITELQQHLGKKQ